MINLKLIIYNYYLVFSLDLKWLKLSSSVIAHGNLFQSDGAAAVNAMSPSVFFVFVDGGTNKS